MIDDEVSDDEWNSAREAVQSLIQRAAEEPDVAENIARDPVNSLLTAGVPEWAIPVVYGETGKDVEAEVRAFKACKKTCAVTHCKGTCLMSHCNPFFSYPHVDWS